MCIPLSKLDIFTIHHDKGPVNYIEVYFEDFQRLLLIPQGESKTIVSIDIYPRRRTFVETTKSIALPEAELHIIEMKDKELRNLRKEVKEIVDRLELVCTCVVMENRKECECINLKVYMAKPIYEVYEALCLEDIKELLKALNLS